MLRAMALPSEAQGGRVRPLYYQNHLSIPLAPMCVRRCTQIDLFAKISFWKSDLPLGKKAVELSEDALARISHTWISS
jgi:hypothetical protein